MEFEDVITTRRAVRKYVDKPIPEEKLQKLYEALQLAPSGNNHQPYKFIFVKNAEKRKEIVSKACHQEFLYDAPVLMLACCVKGRNFDTAIAVDHMILSAVNEGLGTCWVGWFDKDVVRQILEIPQDMDPCILVPLGYEEGHTDARPRKTVSELITVVE